MGFDKNKVTMDLRYKIKQLKRKKYNAEQYKKMNNQKSIKKILKNNNNINTNNLILNHCDLK